MKNTAKATIIETAQQTADKLIVELQHTYPGVNFTLIANEEMDIPNDEAPHIIIKWLDGPTEMAVYKTARPYQSTEDGRIEAPMGYYIRDQHFIGAYYIVPERKLSPERKAAVMKVAESFGYTEKTVCGFQMDLWEEELVANGKLSK